jgi:LmbE family N-acetylglucosaminyl deacetylase
MTQLGNDQSAAELPTAASLRAIFDDQYVLLLAVRPGDEIRGCGGFIAESCARGRPPFVCIVTDGSSDAADARSADELAQARAEQSRAATAMLDLPGERLLLFGLYDGSVPQAGALFERLVAAVADIARRYDCNALCAPLPVHPYGDDLAVHGLAQAVAAHAGLTLIWYAAPGRPTDRSAIDHGAVRLLDIVGHAAQKRIAVQTVTGGEPPCVELFETFVPVTAE